MTFDGLVLTFPGACEYLLVREASGRFSVSIQNLPCGASGLTCTKAVTVRLDSTVVHMLRGGCDYQGELQYCQRVGGHSSVVSRLLRMARAQVLFQFLPGFGCPYGGVRWSQNSGKPKPIEVL